MFTLERPADDRFERGLVGTADLGLARRTHRGKRDDIDLGADRLDPCDGLGRQMPQNRFQPVMACVVQMIGLGRGEKNFIDLRPEEGGQNIAAPRPEGGQNIGQGSFEIAHRGGAGVQRGQCIDEDDLAVEP